MKQIHVECLPDETLVKKLGFTRKEVTHHQGKSRVFNKLKSVTNELALVDEDPGSVKTNYEMALALVEESNGIKYYKDNNGNKIFVLKGKLEDWIISICNDHHINISTFGLPEQPNDLHDVINQRINKLEILINHLLEMKNLRIVKLKTWLNS